MNRDRYTKILLALWNFCVELAEAALVIWLAVLLPKKMLPQLVIISGKN